MFLCLCLCLRSRRGCLGCRRGSGRVGSGEAAALGQALQCQSVSSLEVRVLVDLGGAQRVSSVDSGGGRGADVGLVGKLGLVLAVVQGGRGQHAVAHADWDLVDDARWVASMLNSVTRRAL